MVTDEYSERDPDTQVNVFLEPLTYPSLPSSEPSVALEHSRRSVDAQRFMLSCLLHKHLPQHFGQHFIVCKALLHTFCQLTS